MTSIKDNTISDKWRKDNPFAVPDGYFDSLTDSVMNHIPLSGGNAEPVSYNRQEQPVRKSKILALSSYAYKIAGIAVAACLVVALTLTVTRDREEKTYSLRVNTETQGVKEAYDDSYSEAVMDYAMLDGGDVYSYLSGDEY